MNRQRWIKLIGVAAALGLGAVIGFIAFSGADSQGDTSTSAGSGTSLPPVQGLRLAPGFQNQVPVAVVEGDVVEAKSDQLSISVTSIAWESVESRQELDSVWPVVGDVLSVSLIEAELDSDTTLEGTAVMVLLNNRSVEGEWLVQLVAAVDGESVSVVSDQSGRVDEQLSYIAAQIGESLYETFIRTAADLRTFKDATIANGGDEPEDKPSTLKALQDFDTGATRDSAKDAAWLAAKPHARDYDDAPDHVRESATELHIRFNVADDFLAADVQDSIITVRDGVAVGFAFRAAVGTIEEESIPVSPGQDLQIVIGPGAGFEGAVAAIIASEDWDSASVVEVAIAGTADEPIVSLKLEPKATP